MGARQGVGARAGRRGAQPTRIALVGETLGDVRRVMIEGVSGLLAVHAPEERPRFEPSKLQLVWPNGAIAQIFSAEDPDSLRGPQFDAAWCDEIAKWRLAEDAWDMLQFALRLGARPQVVVTTTPRPIPLSEAADGRRGDRGDAGGDGGQRGEPGADVRRRDDAALRRHARSGARSCWARSSTTRRASCGGATGSRRIACSACPELSRIVVAVDPPVTATANSDACGIVVAGLGADGRAYVAADRTLQGREPHVWARAVIAAYHEFMADRVVAEVNQGGDLVVDGAAPDRSVASRCARCGRRAASGCAPSRSRRSTPKGASRMWACSDVLEDQMCAFGADGLARGEAPTGVDALVWALTDLMLDARRRAAACGCCEAMPSHHSTW